MGARAAIGRTARDLCLAAFGLASAVPAAAEIISTTNTAAVATFSDGADVEHFDDLQGTSLSNYGAGQTIDPASEFHTRDGAKYPTFHSGGASPSDPVGNPGSPIGIVAPSGGIAGDVVSGANVAAPLVIFTDEPWNFGFMEVIFPQEVERVGFWITHGSVQLSLRDRSGNNLTTGDVEVTGDEGFFIGIKRDTADIAVAAMIAAGGGDAFAIDDFTSTAVPAPEASAPLLLTAGAAVLGLVGRRRRP